MRGPGTGGGQRGRFICAQASQQQATGGVLLTTSLHERDQLRARQLPIADFLTKPLTRTKVTALLAEHFAGAPLLAPPGPRCR